jgi:hypothetical protein
MQDIVDFVAKTMQEVGGGNLDKVKVADASATMVSEVTQEVSASAASEAAAEAAAEAGFSAPRFGAFR